MTHRGDLQTLEELAVRIELEPSLQDVYVEGPGDVAIMRALFAETGITASVYSVKDRLDVRRPEVELYSEDYGNKAILVAAAAIIEGLVGSDSRSVLFVVDSDWAQVTGPMPIAKAYLEHTDLPSMEHYFLDERSFQRFLTQGLQRQELSASVVREQISNALLDVAAARIALEHVKVKCFANPFSVATFTSTESSADTQEIIKRSLAIIPAASRPATWQELTLHSLEYKRWLRDAKHLGRGHDIAPALIHALKLKGDFAHVEVLESLMRASVDTRDLLGHDFFRRVVERCRT
jgi:hypothetical protein